MPQAYTFKPGEQVYVNPPEGKTWKRTRVAKFLRYTSTGHIVVLIFNSSTSKEFVVVFNADRIKAKGVTP